MGSDLAQAPFFLWDEVYVPGLELAASAAASKASKTKQAVSETPSSTAHAHTAHGAGHSSDAGARILGYVTVSFTFWSMFFVVLLVAF